MKSRRGTDEWSYSEFIEDLAREGLDRGVKTLHLYRVAVDHYILNPVDVATRIKELKGRVYISRKTLEEAMVCARRIYEHIKATHHDST